MSLWVQRTSTGGGTLVHYSKQTDGQGYCVDLIGFSFTSQIIANAVGPNNPVTGPVLSANTWTHIATTYSQTNGLTLYVNGVSVGSTAAWPEYAPGKPVILTLGNSLNSVGCNSQSIATGPFYGYLDEFRVYSRELSATEVYALTKDKTCFDGLMNGDETDIDCGGLCSACAAYQMCKVNLDCTTGSNNSGCLNGYCELCTLSSQSTWSQTATTIFGSQAGTSGSSLSLLSQPIGMYYDESNNMLIVSDYGNQRILQFSINYPPSVATIIAGGNGDGCNMNQFTVTIGVALDSSRQLYVGDSDCNRVIRFPANSNSTTSGTVVGSVAEPANLFINQLTGDIYVVSYGDNAIYKFVGGSGSPVVAAGGNGYGNALNQLAGPNGVYYDYLYTNSLYVMDNDNQRVMKFPSDSTMATYGTVVAGGNGAGSGANQFNRPRTILVDSSGTLYIADGYNNRIQRWLQNATSGTTIVGGTSGTASNQLRWPEQILFDKYNNLLVVDRNNNRIQLFKLTTC
ncbi:unnamed protein product [Adineta steineri]|uniref:LamG-like jellyroll fold domain-containing protein n=1 Tax=Adineta steineri TaxID=433720 RepID=A0A818JDR1_9BILA|nr:unnamed protein product [Adineta steineri]CAF3539366.1 unnamed protein product [Adineta steineri]